MIKKASILTTAVLLLSVPFFAHAFLLTNTVSKKETQDIPLMQEENQVKPRSVITESFKASYNEQALIIDVENYTGSVAIKIIGTEEIEASFSFSGIGTEYIDISSLSSGLYFLSITTESSVYTGYFCSEVELEVPSNIPPLLPICSKRFTWKNY